MAGARYGKWGRAGRDDSIKALEGIVLRLTQMIDDARRRLATEHKKHDLVSLRFERKSIDKMIANRTREQKKLEKLKEEVESA